MKELSGTTPTAYFTPCRPGISPDACRRFHHLPATLASASYDANNRLTQWGSQTLSYDADGNLTGDGTNSYTWNTRNQLMGISGGSTASFVYDALGRRESKTIGGTSTNFLYDGLNLEQELNGTTPTVNYLTGAGIDEVFSRTDSTGSYSYLTDNLGSSLALTNSSDAISTSYSYEPYGNTTQSGSASTNALQYTGRENDGTGLYYYRARYYNPTYGRFIGEDPMGFSGSGPNLYSYVLESPINMFDALGLSSLVFNPGDGTLTVLNGSGQYRATFPASNNADSRSNGAWPLGTFSYADHTTHASDAPNSKFGSYGNFVFNVPGRPYMGVHSGRASHFDKAGRYGYRNATMGCIRTTDSATLLLSELNNSNDPLTSITVTNSPVLILPSSFDDSISGAPMPYIP